MTDIRTHFINEIFQNISKINMSKNDVGQLLRDIRCLIEHEKQIEYYKTLYFYCTWSAHPNIDKNKELYHILEKINIGFTELPIKNSESRKRFNNYIDVIIDALDFKSLSENIKRLFLYYGAIDKLKDKNLIVPICENIVKRKIHYPEDLKNKDLKRRETVLKTAKISEHIEKIEKYLDSTFDVNLDYSKPVIIKSLIVSEVKNNEIFVELEIDSDKNVKIKSSIKII